MKCFKQSYLKLKIELNIPQRTPPVNKALGSPQCTEQTFCRVVQLGGGSREEVESTDFYLTTE